MEEVEVENGWIEVEGAHSEVTELGLGERLEVGARGEGVLNQSLGLTSAQELVPRIKRPVPLRLELKLALSQWRELLELYLPMLRSLEGRDLLRKLHLRGCIKVRPGLILLLVMRCQE